MPIYVYKHPDTGEEFEVLRSFSEADNVFVSADGKKCKRVLFPASIAGKTGVIDKNAEPWEKDPGYVKRLNPKYVRTRAGHRERYDPNRHC